MLCLALSGHLLLSGSLDGTARLWDTRANGCVHVLRKHGDGDGDGDGHGDGGGGGGDRREK